jgi:hypothetical protein
VSTTESLVRNLFHPLPKIKAATHESMPMVVNASDAFMHRAIT